MERPRKRHTLRNIGIAAAAVVLLVILAALFNDVSSFFASHGQATPTSAPISQPTQQAVHYPPKTFADLRGLAAKGNTGVIHEFHSESVGAVGACPQPRREVTVDPGLTGQKLAEDFLAYFFGQHLDSPCGSLVLAYHDQSEAGGVYTAGRINFDTTDLNGNPNVDPNATNLKHTLTLDLGGDLSNPQEYIVNY